MQISWYTNKHDKKVWLVKGRLEEFEEAELEPNETYEAKGTAVLRGASDEELAVAKAYMKRNPREELSLRGYFADSREDRRRIIEMIQDNDRFKRHDLEDVIVDRETARHLYGLMVRDAWVDSKGLTSFGREELKECHGMYAVYGYE